VLQEHYNTGLNKYLQETNQICESTDEGDEVKSFLIEYTITPIIGSDYYINTLSLPFVPGHKFLSVAVIENSCRLVEIHDTHIIVEDNVTHSRKRFPEVLGPLFSSTMISILSATKNDQSYFLTILATRFGHWKLDIKTI